MTVKLIGICGAKGHGKDTFGGLLNELLKMESRAKVTAFATPLKEGLSKLFAVPLNHFNDQELKELTLEGYGVSPRYLMTWANDILKPQFGDAFFVSRMGVLWEKCKARNMHLIITDVRYEAEAEFIRMRGGHVVHVVDPRKKIEGTKHSSEEGIPVVFITYRVVNSSTLEDLREVARVFVNTVL